MALKFFHAFVCFCVSIKIFLLPLGFLLLVCFLCLHQDFHLHHLLWVVLQLITYTLRFTFYLHFLTLYSSSPLHCIALIPITSHSIVQFHHRTFYSFSWLFCVLRFISIIEHFVFYNLFLLHYAPCQISIALHHAWFICIIMFSIIHFHSISIIELPISFRVLLFI
jgi:hypothetical protein